MGIEWFTRNSEECSQAEQRTTIDDDLDDIDRGRCAWLLSVSFQLESKNGAEMNRKLEGGKEEGSKEEPSRPVEAYASGS
jgi:hypothetical protein